MDNQSAQNPSASTNDQTDIEKKTAVPYTSPPPISKFKAPSRGPMINLALFGFVILLGCFMTYNFVNHQLTRLAGQSTHRRTNPSVTPSVTPLPPSYQAK